MRARRPQADTAASSRAHAGRLATSCRWARKFTPTGSRDHRARLRSTPRPQVTCTTHLNSSVESPSPGVRRRSQPFDPLPLGTLRWSSFALPRQTAVRISFFSFAAGRVDLSALPPVEDAEPSPADRQSLQTPLRLRSHRPNLTHPSAAAGQREHPADHSSPNNVRLHPLAPKWGESGRAYSRTRAGVCGNARPSVETWGHRSPRRSAPAASPLFKRGCAAWETVNVSPPAPKSHTLRDGAHCSGQLVRCETATGRRVHYEAATRTLSTAASGQNPRKLKICLEGNLCHLKGEGAVPAN